MRSADYVEMTTTSIATSGAGAVTCTQITNTPTFTLVFGSQSTDCSYSIEDTVNKKYESGIGKVASNVLTRTKPQITWDGTTWSDLNPTALTFTGSPTSGDIKIRLAPLANRLLSAMPATQTAVAGYTTYHDYPLSHEIAQIQGLSSGPTLTADREYYTPYLLNVGGVLSGVQFHVQTAVAASNLKWALYACGSDGLPGQKIVDFVTTSTATTGAKTDTATASWTPAGKVCLSPGWYYVGYISGHAIQINGQGSGTSSFIMNPLGRASIYGMCGVIYVAGSYTTGLPAIPSLGSATLGDPGVGNTARPSMGLKVVA